MSQKTFKGFPFFSGSIQYSPSSRETLNSRMCLQESPGEEELDPIFSNDRKNKQSFNRLNFSSFFFEQNDEFLLFSTMSYCWEIHLLFVSRNEAKLFRKQIRVNLFYPRQSLCLHVLFFILFFLSYWTYTFAAVSRVILQFVGSNYDLLLYIRLLVHLCAAFRDSAHHWVHRQLTRIPSKQINLLKLC